MKRGRALAILAVAAVAGLAALWFVRGRAPADAVPGSAGAPTSVAGSAPVPRPGAPAGRPGAQPGLAEGINELAASDVITVEAGSITRGIPLTGTLKATNQTLVRAKVAGELRELLVREGMSVNRGQLIARIDPTEFEWRVKEREAQARSAEAQVEQNRRTLENNRALLAKGFISQNAFDNAQSGYDVALANRDAAVAQLTQARKALADTAVTAPMAGMIAERFVQAGEKVSPDNRIVSIVDLSRMEIEALVPSTDIGAVRLGQPVSLRVEGIDEPQSGQIVRINPATSAGTRSVPVYIGIDNRDPRVRAGLFAQGRLTLERREAVVVIPIAAVRDVAGRLFVYAIDGDRLVERPVRLGLRDEDGRLPSGSTGIVEVVDGLRAGERIVAVNLGTLRVGSRVAIGPAAATVSPTARP